jgi:hypothetical protein
MDPQAVQSIIKIVVGSAGIVVAIGFVSIFVMMIFAMRYGTKLIRVKELERTLRLIDTEGRIAYRNKCAAAMDESKARREAKARAAGDEPQGYLPAELADLALDAAPATQ